MTASDLYAPAIPELLSLFETEPFDLKKARKIASGIEDVNAPILDVCGYSTTYLYEAQVANNVQAVALLLEMGADPNYNNPDIDGDCPLWELQYFSDGRDEDIKKKEVEARYQIAKLFFQHGADPDLTLGSESLYAYVGFRLFEGDEDETGLELLKNLFKILIAYGGGTADGYERIELSSPIDLERLDDYAVALSQKSCQIIDPEGHVIGSL